MSAKRAAERTKAAKLDDIMEALDELLAHHSLIQLPEQLMTAFRDKMAAIISEEAGASGISPSGNVSPHASWCDLKLCNCGLVVRGELPSAEAISEKYEVSMVNRRTKVKWIGIVAINHILSVAKAGASLLSGERTRDSLQDFLERVGWELGGRTNLLDSAVADIRHHAESRLKASALRVEDLAAAKAEPAAPTPPNFELCDCKNPRIGAQPLDTVPRCERCKLIVPEAPHPMPLSPPKPFCVHCGCCHFRGENTLCDDGASEAVAPSAPTCAVHGSTLATCRAYSREGCSPGATTPAPEAPWQTHLREAEEAAKERADCFDKIGHAPCGCEFVWDRRPGFGHPDMVEKRCRLGVAAPVRTQRGPTERRVVADRRTVQAAESQGEYEHKRVLGLTSDWYINRRQPNSDRRKGDFGIVFRDGPIVTEPLRESDRVSAPDATPREENEVNICGMHIVAFSENCDICNAERRAASERTRVRREALEEVAKIAETPERWKKLVVDDYSAGNMTVAGKKIAAAIRSLIDKDETGGVR